MSRVGKKPIPLPKGVKVTIGDTLQVEGPKGKLTVPIPAGIEVRQVEDRMELVRSGDDKAALHGLTRALAANAIHGVANYFTRDLDIVGIGYRAEVKGRVIAFSLGYSHAIEFLLPEGVDVKIEKLTHISLSSADKQRLGQTAADIRALRPPEPYKQKGIRYTGEVLRKKVGKTGASAK